MVLMFMNSACVQVVVSGTYYSDAMVVWLYGVRYTVNAKKLKTDREWTNSRVRSVGRSVGRSGYKLETKNGSRTKIPGIGRTGGRWPEKIKNGTWTGIRGGDRSVGRNWVLPRVLNGETEVVRRSTCKKRKLSFDWRTQFCFHLNNDEYWHWCR